MENTLYRINGDLDLNKSSEMANKFKSVSKDSICVTLNKSGAVSIALSFTDLTAGAQIMMIRRLS